MSARRTLARIGLLALAGTLGCLRAFGPDVRAREQHAGLVGESSGETCMACHVSEPDAIALGIDEQHPAPAPIVAQWMIEESRECVVCHRVWSRERELPASARRLAPLGVADAQAR